MRNSSEQVVKGYRSEPPSKAVTMLYVAGLDRSGSTLLAALDSVDDGYIDLATDHAVSGNPLRFQRGRLELRVDEDRRRSMPRCQRLVVTVITWPLLLRYGYWRRVAPC